MPSSPDRQLSLLAPPEKGAILSECLQYRYHLWRSWGDGGRCAFVCLNPSTADAERDDATLRRMVSFSKSWGMGRLDVVNLFAFRATRPSQCFRVDDPVGPRNDEFIEQVTRKADLVVVAWGANGTKKGRGLEVFQKLKGWGIVPHALRVLPGGHPEHPLYLPKDLRPFPFNL